MNLIERVFTADKNQERFLNYRKNGYVLNGQDAIGINMDFQSVIQFPMEHRDFKIVEIYLK